jgi:enoyl-[acyl-carrier-protein] reductase (NADH)
MAGEIDRTPIGRLAEMEEIGDGISYLASPLSSFMYGSGMVVDGGYSIQ